MNLASVATAALAAGAVAVCVPSPASAHPVNWGAISYSPSTGAIGLSTNWPDENAAVLAANGACRWRDCGPRITFTEGCAAVSESALAWLYVEITGFGKGATRAEAEANAIADLPAGTGSAGARIIGVECNQPPD